MTIVMLLAPGPALYSALRGMTDAGRRLDTGAHNIANVSTEPFAPLRGDGGQGPEGSLDVASELVEATILAPVAYAANAKVAKVAAETQRALLDIRA